MPLKAGAYEKEIWRELFEEASRVYRRLLRSPGDWERIKAAIAELVARVILEHFKTVRRIAMADLSGGECAGDPRPGFDVDLLVLVESPAEEYALRRLGDVMDNALREAFIHTVGYEMYREIARLYRRGIHHNILELHVNDNYARMKSRFCPPVEIYTAGEDARGSC